MKQKNIQAEVIEIITDGLDDVIIDNSLEDKLEVVLLDENPNSHAILIEEDREEVKIRFKLNFKAFDNGVFRKYITKRIERASAVIRVPKNKKVIVYGKSVGVTSKSYKGDLSIFIEKGNVKLNEVQGDVLVKLFLGNVYAELNKNISLDIETTNGKFTLNNKKMNNKFYEKKVNSSPNFKVKSINANVILIRE
ncbi:hypothetical protein F7018_02750 [Tenacibaculum aiptasiae]|uniref:DUF4097 domain-containing protein n=1 Tax=Tenacibaculum aiptasiae TaxID=426481 RepID=A0A7J5AT40_9FLAO|nr:hypothetical protein [Tenacibaculum aiptasiae]KAB1160812.1 hypothetical protein F7018_02750 [Tenacibaculum aiptasiae]